jgi:hypothetical protein
MVMQLLSGRCVKALNIATAMARQNAMTTAPARRRREPDGFVFQSGAERR